MTTFKKEDGTLTENMEAMEVLVDHFAQSDNVQDDNIIHKRMRELTEEQLHTHDDVRLHI